MVFGKNRPLEEVWLVPVFSDHAWAQKKWSLEVKMHGKTHDQVRYEGVRV